MQALLLATLGSLDAAAAGADDGGNMGPAAHGAAAGRSVARRLQNLLRTLHLQHHLLEPIQALLLAHMRGPPAPPRATA